MKGIDMSTSSSRSVRMTSVGSPKSGIPCAGDRLDGDAQVARQNDRRRCACGRVFREELAEESVHRREVRHVSEKHGDLCDVVEPAVGGLEDRAQIGEGLSRLSFEVTVRN